MRGKNSRRRIRKLLRKLRNTKSKMVNCGRRPTLIGKGFVLHAPFCGRDGSGKPVYAGMTKNEGHALVEYAKKALQEALVA